MKIKTRSELLGVHVHTTFWMGEAGYTLANVGTLITDVGQAQTMLAALLIGVRSMKGLVVTEHTGYLSEGWAARQKGGGNGE